jgi:hypothetical protein
MRRYRYNRSRRANEDASMIPASTATTTIQRKATVGKTDDPLEHEADKTADKIMRMPEHPFIQRKGSCSCGEYDDDHVHLKPLANQIKPFIQSKNDGVVSDGVASKIRSTKGGGSPINGYAKSYMETRFGADFSDVKIHTGDESVQLSRNLNAKAFTVGNDIYFNKDQYQPETDKGKHLLAHELTHVVQQGGSKSINSKNSGAAATVLKAPLAETIQRYPGCSKGQDQAINDALARARRRSTRALQVVADIKSGTNPRAAGTLAHYFGVLTTAQIDTINSRMVTADGRLSNAGVWRCDTAATYPQCGPPNSWCAGTNCPDAAAMTHLCPPVFQPESDHVCAEPSRAILLEHEALRAAGVCQGVNPPGTMTSPGSVENIYSYTRFIYSVASANAD